MPSSLPRVTIQLLPDLQFQSTADQKVLFIGQKLPAGSAVAGELITDIRNSGNEDGLFGQKSMIAGGIRAAKSYNQITQFDAIALDDDGGAANSTADIIFAGTPTEDAPISISIGSSKRHEYSIDVLTTSTANTLGAALEGLINADANAPFTASNVSGTVTVTVSNGGTWGNELGIELDANVAGLTVTKVDFSGGATDPSLTGVLDVIAGRRYQSVIWPSQYDLDVIADELDARWDVSNDIMDGVALQVKQDTYANLITLANTLNTRSVNTVANGLFVEANYTGGAVMEIDYNIAAQWGALRALRLTKGAPIATYTPGAANGLDDAFGGVSLATLPYFNTLIPDLPIMDAVRAFTEQESADLKTAGISILNNNGGNTNIVMGETVTTYKTTAEGTPDLTFKTLNNVDASSAIREIFFNNLKARFSQSRLTDGEVIPSSSMANEAVVRNFIVEVYSTMSGRGFLLTRAGDEALNFFKANLDISLELAEGKVLINMVVPIVNQLRQIDIALQIKTDNIN